ncbi:MAG: zf-TFIIB domain-containing protein [Segniliparus sp.]|uniref:TFIIB-type zinc ribbon-containing protein n=1 Tax=Segniliparus sp. TaxID=2804064 RepID=UPI003F385651
MSDDPAHESPLVCPRCVGQMLMTQRFGSPLHQCSGCGGTFFDRNELEQLLEAARRLGAPPQPQYYPQAPQTPPAQPGVFGGLFGGHDRYPRRHH